MRPEDSSPPMASKRLLSESSCRVAVRAIGARSKVTSNLGISIQSGIKDTGAGSSHFRGSYS